MRTSNKCCAWWRSGSGCRVCWPKKMEDLRRSGKQVAVSIGSENEMKELQNVSIVSSAYRVGDKTVGMLGHYRPQTYAVHQNNVFG